VWRETQTCDLLLEDELESVANEETDLGMVTVNLAAGGCMA
jgi:hypothetical protein